MFYKEAERIYLVMKTAQKLFETFKTNTIPCLIYLCYTQLLVTIIVHFILVSLMNTRFQDLDNRLMKIEHDLNTISEKVDYLSQDVSDLIILSDQLNQKETEPEIEEIQEPVTIYGDEDKDKIVSMIFEIAPMFDVSPYMIMAMVERESNYKPQATNGQYKGLLQISERWHGSRMKELGVSDLYDPAGNITVACSYLKDLYDLYEDQELVLMCYSMDNNKAMELHRKGQVSVYATAVIDRMRELEEGYGD